MAESKYNEDRTNEILKRRFGTAEPLPTGIIANLPGGFRQAMAEQEDYLIKRGLLGAGRDIASGASKVGSAILYGKEGPAPAVKPVVSTPSSAVAPSPVAVAPSAYEAEMAKYLGRKAQDQFGGSASAMDAYASKTAMGGAVPRMSAPVMGGLRFGQSSPEQIEKAKADYQAWMARSAANVPSGGLTGGTMTNKARQAQAVEQERRPFVAQEAQRQRDAALAQQQEITKQEIAKGEATAALAMGTAKERAQAVRDAAESRSGADVEAAKLGLKREELKSLIDAMQSEDENVRKAVSAQLMKLYGGAEGGQQPSISVDDARAQAKAAGKKQFKLGGKIYDV